MKHAGPDALDRLEPLLALLRARAGMKEKSRGIFYRGSKAFLHFHEHGPEFFADIKTGGDFERFPATRPADRAALLKRVDALLGDGNRKPAR
jgi:hypothetical protein